MRRWAAFIAVFLLVGAALFWSQLRTIEAPVGPEPILHIIADTERELTRLPVAFTPLSDSEEIKIGKELEQSYVHMWPANRDESQAIENYIQNYLQEVGTRVAAHAHRKLPYRIHYISNLDFINAFALPGGPVFIGAGLLSLMDREDELAAVLGHEIEHIDHYHCAERIQVEAALRRAPLGELVALPVEIFVAGYSKDQELEADRESSKLAAAASYSPQGAVRMFQAFERVHPVKSVRTGTPQEELSKIARSALEGYFRSHPPNAERIDQIRKMIAADQLPAWTGMKPFSPAYLFLTARALRSLQAAQMRSHPFLTGKQKREWEAARVKDYQQAVELASRSLQLTPNEPQAMEIVGLAEFGLGDFSAAGVSYRKLLPQYPAYADAIRIAADALAKEALDSQEYDNAAKLAKQSLELQPNQPQALKILAEAQFWTSDFRGAAETGSKIANLYPDTADEVRLYADQLAAAKLAEHQYQEAASLAAQSIELKPGQQIPLTILARAQFALGNFSSAASGYRQLLDQNASDINLVRGYTDALSAANPTVQTGRDFEAWLARVGSSPPALATQMRVELAGLKLMTGDETLARTIIAQAQGPERDVVAPELLGRLAWWYYRARNYEASTAVLREALTERPGDLTLQAVQAWNELEQHQLDDAIRRFTTAAAEPSWNSPLMGRAVARWQTHQAEGALKDFHQAAQAFPEWRNPQWVEALYPASVAQTVTQMNAEWERRQNTKKLPLNS